MLTSIALDVNITRVGKFLTQIFLFCLDTFIKYPFSNIYIYFYGGNLIQCMICRHCFDIPGISSINILNGALLLNRRASRPCFPSDTIINTVSLYCIDVDDQENQLLQFLPMLVFNCLHETIVRSIALQVHIRFFL